MENTLEQMFHMGLIDTNGDLTEKFGKISAILPFNPKLTILVLNSFEERFQCSKEILALVSMLNFGRVFKRQKDSGQVIATKKKIGAKEGDLITLINVFFWLKNKSASMRKKMCSELFLKFDVLEKAFELFEKLNLYFEALGFQIKSSNDDVDNIQRCIFWSLYNQIAFSNNDQTYTVLNGREVARLSATSLLNTVYPQWILFYESETACGKFNEEMILNECLVINEEWIVEKMEEKNKNSSAVVEKKLSETKVQKSTEKPKIMEGKKIKKQFLSGMDETDW